jgi:hypothetical protein
MIPIHTYTAVIDVLSYRYRLEKDQKEGTLSFKNDLEKALKIFDEINSTIFRVQAISDTIILTCQEHTNFIEFLNVLKQVFFTFLECGLFVRGGIAYSRHFENGRLTYSHAIARAHELESKAAIYPRILLDNNIVDMYKSSTELPNIFEKEYIVKQNGAYFLHILEEYNWEEIHRLVAKIYSNDKRELYLNEAAFAKHQWFENYLYNFKPSNTVFERYINPMELI